MINGEKHANGYLTMLELATGTATDLAQTYSYTPKRSQCGLSTRRMRYIFHLDGVNVVVHELWGDDAYRYMITHDFNMKTYDEIRRWIVENRIPCTVVPGALYLSDKKHVELLLLRWA